MANAQRRAMTVTEFLSWEERQELRYEFDGFQPVAMTGGTLRHDRITFNLRRALDDRLGGGPCRALGPNVKIRAAERIRYPDGVVTCVPQDELGTLVEAPVVVFEVISDGSSLTDRIVKPREYLACSTIQRYVVLEQDNIAATVFERAGDVWQARTVAGEEVVEMPEINVRLPITACYEGVNLPDTGNSPR